MIDNSKKLIYRIYLLNKNEFFNKLNNFKKLEIKFIYR